MDPDFSPVSDDDSRIKKDEGAVADPIESVGVEGEAEEAAQDRPALGVSEDSGKNEPPPPKKQRRRTRGEDLSYEAPKLDDFWLQRDVEVDLDLVAFDWNAEFGQARPVNVEHVIKKVEDIKKNLPSDITETTLWEQRAGAFMFAFSAYECMQ